MPDGTEIGIFEAKTHFSEVVDRVVREGRAVTVTRRGQPVVDIVPSSAARGARMTRAEALAALAKLRRELPRLGFDEIRAMASEGRERWPDS